MPVGGKECFAAYLHRLCRWVRAGHTVPHRRTGVCFFRFATALRLCFFHFSAARRMYFFHFSAALCQSFFCFFLSFSVFSRVVTHFFCRAVWLPGNCVAFCRLSVWLSEGDAVSFCLIFHLSVGIKTFDSDRTPAQSLMRRIFCLCRNVLPVPPGYDVLFFRKPVLPVKKQPCEQLFVAV